MFQWESIPVSESNLEQKSTESVRTWYFNLKSKDRKHQNLIVAPSFARICFKNSPIMTTLMVFTLHSVDCFDLKRSADNQRSN